MVGSKVYLIPFLSKTWRITHDPRIKYENFMAIVILLFAAFVTDSRDAKSRSKNLIGALGT